VEEEKDEEAQKKKKENEGKIQVNRTIKTTSELKRLRLSTTPSLSR